MVRCTVQDHEKTVSFLGDMRLARCLVASCATEPRLLEDVLIAAEPYYEGATARIMQDLIQFDATIDSIERAGLDSESLSRLFHVTRPSTVDVIDDVTRRIAARAENEGILMIDLPAHHVSGRIASDQPIALRGRLDVEKMGVRQEITYVLNDTWTVAVRHGLPLPDMGSETDSVYA